MIVILLPAYNEEVSLPPLFEKIEKAMGENGFSYKIVMANDGSSDKTAELAREYSAKIPLEVLEHKINRGLGETSRDLFERAVEITSRDDIIVRMDCDDTHEPEVIKEMAQKISDGCDVVIASRFQPGGGQLGVNAYRAFISRGANLFMKIFFPIKGVYEYSCGFRAYRASIIKDAIEFYGNNFIQLKGMGFTCTLEKLIKLKLLGARFGEVPFILKYNQKVSASKMIGSVTTFGYFSMVVMHYWPWGGWRSAYSKKLKNFNSSSSE